MTGEVDLTRLWRPQRLPVLSSKRTAIIAIDRHRLSTPDQVAADCLAARGVEKDHLANLATTEERLNKVIEACRAVAITVIDSVSPSSGRIPDNSAPGTICLERGATSFFASGLGDQILRNLGIDTLMIAGMDTERAVASTARDGADRGFKIVVLSDACASHSQELHDHSMRILSLWYAHVTTASALLASL